MRKRKGEEGVERLQEKSYGVVGDQRETHGFGGRMASNLKNQENIALVRKNEELQSGKGASLE